MSEDISVAFSSINQHFSKEEIKLRECSDLRSYDFKSLWERLEKLKERMQDGRENLNYQLSSGSKAIASVQAFYETFVNKFGDIARDQRQRNHQNSYSGDPQKDLFHSEKNKQQTEELQKQLEWLKTTQDATKLFEEVAEMMLEVQNQMESCELKVEQMKESLEEAKRQQEIEDERKKRELEEQKAMEVRRRQIKEEQVRKDRIKSAKDEERKMRQQMSAEEQERLQKEQEAEEMARRDPRNWNKFVFEVDSENSEFEHSIGAVIRACDDCINSQRDVKVSLVDNIDLSSLSANEEVVGNVVRIEPNGLQEFEFSYGWAIAVPHCAQRNNARETVVFTYNEENGHWYEEQSSEVHIDLENVDIPVKFVEFKSMTSSVTCVAINKVKTDRFVVGKRGGRIQSSVDNRISLTYPAGAVKVTLDHDIQIQPVDATLMNQLKEKEAKLTNGLLTISSLIEYQCNSRKRALKPLTFSFPLPLNPAASSSSHGSRGKPRPGTAAPGIAAERSGNLSQRPKTAAGVTREDDEGEEVIHLMGKIGKDVYNDDAPWRSLNSMFEIFEQKNKDVLDFEMNYTDNIKFIAMRTKAKVNEDSLSKLCHQLEELFLGRTALFLLRQNENDLSMVQLCVCPAYRKDRALRQMAEGGYTIENATHASSDDIKVHERQEFTVHFRGNVRANEMTEDDVMKLTFNSQLKNRLKFQVHEIDKYAQRAIEHYRGFAQVRTVEVFVKNSTKEEIKKGAPAIVEEFQEKVVTDLLICINKSEDDLQLNSQRNRNRFQFRSNDSVTNEYLEDLSREVKDNWESLAENLGMKRVRCSAIKRQSGDREEQALDMLLTWVQRQPTSQNKATLLANALFRSGHYDIAEALKDSEKDLQASRKGERPTPRNRTISSNSED